MGWSSLLIFQSLRYYTPLPEYCQNLLSVDARRWIIKTCLMKERESVFCFDVVDVQ
jgi:hypothetical protein